MSKNLLQHFLATLNSDHTKRAYRADIYKFFGNRSVDEEMIRKVDPEDVQQFLQAMEEEGHAASTQQRRLTALRRFFDWLSQQEILTASPIRGTGIQISTSESSTETLRVLSEEEIRLLIKTAKQQRSTGVRDYALLLTILYGALRRSDVAKLDVEDVRPLGRHWILDLDSIGAYVKIPDIVVDAIETMKATYDISSGPLWRSFSNRNKGERLSPDAIYKVVRRTAQEADLGDLNIDTLRRTGLHHALQGGARLPQIQAHGRLTHSASAASYFDSSRRRGSLHESAVDCIDIDIEPSTEDSDTD